MSESTHVPDPETDPGQASLEERLLQAIDALPERFALLTPLRSCSGSIEDFRYDFVNAAGCRMARLRREDLLGRRLQEGLLSLDRGLFEDLCRVMETGIPLNREVGPRTMGVLPEAGEHLEVLASRLGNGLAVAWREASAQGLAIQALEDQASRFRAIFENSLEGVLLTSPEGSIHAANPAACRITGFSEKEIRVGGRELLVDASDPRLPVLLAERVRSGHARGELLFKRGNGIRFPVECSSTVFRGPGGDAFTVITFRDISEEKRLEGRSQRLSSLVESTEDAIYALDLEEIITDWNAGAAALYGYAPEEAIGRTPSLIMTEASRAEFSAVLDDLRKGQRVRGYQAKRRRKDGALIDVSVTVSAIRLPDGALAGFSVIGRDITAQVEAAAERERLIGELQEALAEVRTLSGLVPICAQCKRIRDDQGYWLSVEKYIQDRTDAKFSHGICPKCVAEFFPAFSEDTPPEQNR